VVSPEALSEFFSLQTLFWGAKATHFCQQQKKKEIVSTFTVQIIPFIQLTICIGDLNYSTAYYPMKIAD
jgi:hypothetical protein